MELSRSSVALLTVLSLSTGGAGVYLALQGRAPADSAGASSTAGLQVAASAGAVEADAPAAPPRPPVDRQRTARMLRPQPARTAEAPPIAAASPAPAPEQAQPESPVRDVVAVPQDATALNTTPAPPTEPPAPAEPPAPQYDELVVAADSVIGLEVEGTVSSETARVEDPVRARVTRDVRIGSRLAIPAGSTAVGEVVVVERGGRLRERARLGVQFHTLLLPDGVRLPLDTAMVYREGSAPAVASASRIGGGALGGAIIGGILGGGKGAAIGGSIGAGAGTAAAMAGGRRPAELPSGALVTVRLQAPVVVTVEH